MMLLKCKTPTSSNSGTVALTSKLVYSSSTNSTKLQMKHTISPSLLQAMPSMSLPGMDWPEHQRHKQWFRIICFPYCAKKYSTCMQRVSRWQFTALLRLSAGTRIFGKCSLKRWRNMTLATRSWSKLVGTPQNSERITDASILAKLSWLHSVKSFSSKISWTCSRCTTEFRRQL